jgi:hypothetical protein
MMIAQGEGANLAVGVSCIRLTVTCWLAISAVTSSGEKN